MAGAVFAPALGVLYVAGNSAYRIEVAPGEKLAASRNMQVLKARPRPASQWRAVTSRSHLDPDTQSWIDSHPVAELRAAGSSLKFCTIAEGDADVYPRLAPTMEWDTAAGDAVLRAAGGSVLDLAGGAVSLRQARLSKWLICRLGSAGRRSAVISPRSSYCEPTMHQLKTADARHALPKHLKRLEAESIEIMRDVVADFKKPVMMYSIGKDSSVMLHLAIKAFYPAKLPVSAAPCRHDLEIPGNDRLP